jgi:hypothetical protein
MWPNPFFPSKLLRNFIVEKRKPKSLGYFCNLRMGLLQWTFYLVLILSTYIACKLWSWKDWFSWTLNSIAAPTSKVKFDWSTDLKSTSLPWNLAFSTEAFAYRGDQVYATVNFIKFYEILWESIIVPVYSFKLQISNCPLPSLKSYIEPRAIAATRTDKTPFRKTFRTDFYHNFLHISIQKQQTTISVNICDFNTHMYIHILLKGKTPLWYNVHMCLKSETIPLISIHAMHGNDIKCHLQKKSF